MRIKIQIIGLVCSLVFVPLSFAKDPGKLSQDKRVITTSNTSKLTISNAYMPKVPPVSRTAAIYLIMKNSTDATVVLSGASTSIAHHVMIHQTVESDGVVKMKHQSNVTIPAGEAVEFVPGGTHIMLMGLQKDTIPDPFVLDLIYDDQSRQSIDVKVGSRSK